MKCSNWQVFGRGWSKKLNNIKLCQKVETGLATLMKFSVVMEMSKKIETQLTDQNFRKR